MKALIKAIGFVFGGCLLLALLCFPEMFRLGMSKVALPDAKRQLSRKLDYLGITVDKTWSIVQAIKSPGRDSTWFMQFDCSAKDLARLTNMLWQADGKEYLDNRKWIIRKGEPSEMFSLAKTPKWWPSSVQGFTVIKVDSVIGNDATNTSDNGIWFFISADETVFVWIWDT